MVSGISAHLLRWPPLSNLVKQSGLCEVHLKIFWSETIAPIAIKLLWNCRYMVLYKNFAWHSVCLSNIAAWPDLV